MFTIQKMSSASEWYYLSLVNYYLGGRSRKKAKKRRRPGEDDFPDDDSDFDPDDSAITDADPYTINTPGEPPGKWWGKGAAALGLVGMVREDDYHLVFQGFHPSTKIELVQNAGLPTRRAGYECCFSVPKPVSVLWTQMSPADRERLQKVVWQAAEAALRLIEQRFVYSRVGKASEGCSYVHVGLVVPMFEHAAARPTFQHHPDPDLHIHTQPLNLGVDKEGHWRSIEPKAIFANQRIITGYWRAFLAAGLRAEFGLTAEAKRNGFTLPDVPEELVKLYSKRSKVILEYRAEKGLTGKAARSRAALATRERKDPPIARQQLFDQWQKTNVAAGFGDKQVAKLLRHGPRKPKGTIKKVIQEAVKELTRQRNHFAKDDLLLHTLSLLPNYGLRPDTVFDEVDHFLAHDPNIVPLGTHDGIPRYTTRRILAEERRILSAVDRLSARPGNALSEQAVSRQLENNPTLSQEQVQFVRHLTQKNSAFRIGLGLAGTGKTSRAVKACVEAWQRRGYRVLIAAPTGQAARVVGNEISLQGETLTKFLGDFKFPLSAALIHHGWQFIRAARGKRTWRFRQPKPALITPKTIVLVDEAGMISTPQMLKLAELVEKGGGTLCLIGDPAQLPAVETTSPLHSLSRRYGAATLKDIRRQRALWARRAAKLFAAGRVGPALAVFAKKNRITVRDDIEETVRQACLDWTAEGLLTPHRVLILANENHLTHTANQICQEHRLRAGVLQSGCSIRVTDEQEEAVYESRVYVHDRVIFTKNSRGRKGYGVDVDNGSLGTVTAIRPFTFTPEIAVVLDDGRHVRVNVSDYRHIRLGYSVSTYRAQGASIAKIHAIVGGTLQSLPSSYVQATRGVEDTFLYTTKDLLNASLENIQDSPLAKQMSRKPDLRLASDLLTDAPPSFRKRKPRIRRAAIEPSVPSVPHDQQPTPVLPPQSEPPKKTSPRPAPSSKRAPQSSQPPQAPKLPAANSLPSRRSSSPPKPLDRKSSQSPPLPAPIPPAQSQAPIPQSSHVTSSDSPFRPVIAVPPPQQPAASPYQSSLPPASSTSTSPPHAPSVPYYPSPVHASPAPHEPGSFRPAPFPDLSVPSTFAQAAQSLGIFPGGPPLPTPATIQPFDASSGFQRMRLPLGTWNVTTNPSVLSASCVDGGISDACRRAPAPVDQTMAFSSPSITVQRITPAPSALMTLEQATRAGVFSLIGTGCCDNLRVRCARGEVWQISVASHLALISAQNDIAPAEKHYNRPAVLTELSRLDQLDHQVMALSARRCFLTSLFACARRQIAWLLPAATDAVAIANTILGRLCQLLFEDPEANELLESYADSIRSLDILGIAKALQTSMSDLPHPPSPETLLAIGRAIAKGESEKEFLPACVQSVMKQYSSVVTEAALSSTIDTMAKTIVGAKIVFQRSQGTPQQAAAIVNLLYCAANRQPPQRIQVPSILTHHAGLEFAFLQAYPFARLVYDYANSYLNGNWDFVRGFYCNFKSIPWHR